MSSVPNMGMILDHDASRKNLTYAGGFATENSNTTVVVDYATRNAIFNSDRPVNVTFESSTRMTIDGEDYAESWCGDDTQKVVHIAIMTMLFNALSNLTLRT